MMSSGQVSKVAGVTEVFAGVQTSYLCPPHFHETYCISVFCEKVSIRCRGRDWVVRPGQIVVLEPREVHGGTPQSAISRQDGFCPCPEFLIELFSTAEPVHFPTPLIDDSALADRLHRAATSNNERELREAIEAVFLFGVPSMAGNRNPVMDPSLSLALDPRNGGSHSLAGLSRSHFSRKVKAILGLSPRDFKRLQRVKTARTMIEGGMPLSACAVEAGFADQAHMSRQVRSLTGLTPRSLRRIDRP